MTEHFKMENQEDKHFPHLPWIMKQTWSDVLFAHYPVNREALQKLVPNELPLDTFNGVGWVSIVPYFMSSMRLRGLPPIPGMNRFPGFNVRTYVKVNGKPGIYFFSLTAANWFAANTAKIFFRLPYVYVDSDLKNFNHIVRFKSIRKNDSGMQLSCNYQSISNPFLAEKGSLDEWLVERYSLYTVSKKGVPLCANIMHHPWLLEKAGAEFHQNSIVSNFHIKPETNKPILHYSKKAVVRIWPLVSAAK